MDGSVYPLKDKNGRTVGWAYQLVVGWKNGKAIKVKHQSKQWTKRQAQIELAAVRKKHQEGIDVRRKMPTTREWLEKWFTDVYEPSHRATSNNTIRYAIKRICAHVGDVAVDKLTGAMVRDMWTALRKKGTAARTLDQTRNTGLQAFDLAIADDLISKNPFSPKAAPVPGKREAIGQAITPEQGRAFVAACEAHRYGLALQWCITFGFRRMEACGIRDEDIDLDRGILVVNGGVTYAPGVGVQYGDTKTENGRRAFRLPPRQVASARAHIARREEEREAMGDAWQDSGFLFVRTTDGKAIYPSYLNTAFKEIAASIGLDPSIRLHDMRHTHASYLHEAGVSTKNISAALGHANTRITENLYIHLFNDALSDAAAAVDAMLTPETLEMPERKEEVRDDRE